MTIYALSPSAQKAEFDAYCLGACKRVRVGTVYILAGEFAVCGEANCPHMDREAPVIEGLTLRHLKAVT